jgi:hypothetical protein
MTRTVFNRAVLAVVAAVVAGVALHVRSDAGRWTAFVFPPPSSGFQALSQSSSIGRYPTLNECKSAAVARLKAIHADPGPDNYMCGFQCSPRRDAKGLLACADLGE